MLDFFFQGLFHTDISDVISIGDFLLCVGCALVIGMILAFGCRYQGRYTKSFLVTLALLPTVVCVVIMMVNGSVGAGVAVAGAFSLVRFRSAPGTGREITMLFLAMGAGLISGMGYLALALLFTVIMTAMNIVFAGSITITESYEGIEGLHVCISGGNIALTASDDGLNAAGGMDGSGFGRRTDTFTQSADTPSIVISGGNVRIMASADGIDANGSLEITGGEVTVCGPIQGDTSVLDYDQSGVITGGTFIGTGASAMAQTFSGSKQGVISVNAGTQKAGTKITLTGSDGRLLLSYTPEQDFQVVILSAPDIRQGESYSLTIGDQSGTFTAQ